jgi:protein tyrosine phosphatase
VTYDKSIIHHTFPLSDSKRQNILQYLDKADSLISAGTHIFNIGLKVGSVLVHCAAGVSRVSHMLNTSQQLWSLHT